jgi:putative tryptophan/tyrosine transport system substrate-binding protein
MRRRRFLSGLGGAAVALPLVAGTTRADAQAPGRVYRLGHLSNTKLSETLTRETTLPALAKLGFVEGSNLVFDGRIGEPGAMPGLVREILAAKADAVIAIGDAAIVAAAGVTRAVPIIGFGGDPVKHGLAQSYARPGGNVTGVTILADELEVVRLSMLREAAPDRRRMAVLMSTSQRALIEPALRKAAPGLGLELLVFPVATPADYPAAFAAMRAAGAEALVIGAAPELFRDGKQLAALALEAKLPTICEWAEMARAGCLIGYGPSRAELRKRMAAQVALIFRGDAPGNVAIELPVKFESALNLQIAKRLGLTIPQSLLLLADEVIQ